MGFSSVHVSGLGRAVATGHSLSITAGNYWDVSNVHLSPARSIHSGFVRLKQNASRLKAVC